MGKRIISMLVALLIVFSSVSFASVALTDDLAQTGASNLTKTATWTNEDKTQAEIQLTSTFDKKIVDGKILFLGGLCNAHTLEQATVVAAIEACAQYGIVDYELYSVSESQSETSGTPITGTLEKGKTLSSTVKTNIKNKLASQRHVIQYKIADKLNSTDLSKYDAVVMEFDGFKMGRQSSAPTTAQRNNLAAAGNKLLPLYQDGKVLWIIPPKSEHGTYDGTSTYLFGDYYISNKDISGSSKISDNMRKAAFDCLALIAPEDYLTADGKPKSYPTFGTTALNNLKTMIARANASEKNKIYVTYEESAKVSTFLQKKFSSHGYQTVDVRDEVKDGFKITGVSGQYYDATSKTYKAMPTGTFSHKINGQVVTATFDVTKLEYANVRLIINVIVDPENDPFEDAITVDTNEGDATAKYMDEDDEGKPVVVHSEEVEPANLSKKEFPIVTNVVNGTISETKYILDGGSYTVEYAPKSATGYVLDSIKVDGDPVSLVTYKDSYTFTNIKEGHEIDVVYLPTYPVTFNTRGGSTITPQIVKKGDKVEKPEDPTKTGYTFYKWYADDDLKEEFDFDTPITEPTTIYADYTLIEYTLHYDANGDGATGAPEDQIMVISDEARISTVEPVWPGHTFKGWSTDSDAKTASYLPDGTFKAAGVDKAPDTTLYAVWDSDVVQINYEANEGGSVSPTAETILADPDPSETLGGSTATPKEGYHFVEWRDENSEPVSTDPTFIPTKPGDIYLPATYTAYFQINEYTVTFDMQDLVPDFTEIVEHGNYATPETVPTIEGYDFDNYYVDEERETPYNFETPITEDTTIYGNFIEHTADITYYMNDGTTDVFESDELKYTEEKVITDGVPEREHYVFKGWDESPAATDPTYPKGSTDVLKEANVEPEKIELYAIWDKEIYTVDFVSEHGTKPEDQKIAYEDKVVEPPMSETGYTFDGWYTEDTFDNKYDFDTPVEKDFTLYGKWTEKDSTITYIAVEGDKDPYKVDKILFTEEESIPTDPQREHYVFKGWDEDPKADTPTYTKDNPVVKPENTEMDDTTLYGIWDKEEYTVKFEANGGTPAPADQIVSYQDKVTEPDPAPEKTGYKFTGWYTDEECKNEYDFDTEVDKDFTLYAGYEQIDYELSFDANGGKDAPEKITMRFEEAAEIPTSEPTYPGHTFSGWATSKENADKGIVAFEAGQTYRGKDTDKAPSTTLYAVWDNVVVQISYNAEKGGTVNPTSETINQDPGPSETLGGSKAIPNEGYHFVEWKNADNEQVGTDPTFIPSKPESGLYEPAEYTAFFAINQYVVTFDTDGRTESFTDVVNHGDKVSKPTDPSIEGYNFDGWYKDPSTEETFDFNTPITETTTIYGKWSEMTAPLHYDANGGKETYEDKTMSYTKEETVISDVPTRDHYNFEGWSTNSKAESGDYFDGDVFKEEKVVPVESTLYAIWSKEIYTVDFVINGHGKQPDPQDVEYLDHPEDPGKLEEYGYTFEGWYADEELTIPYNFNLAIEEDTTVYAKWTEKETKITYYGTKDAILPYKESTVKYTDEEDIPATDPVRDHYVFLGWDEDPDTDTPTYTKDNPVVKAEDTEMDDTVLYGIWEKGLYTVDFETNGGTPVPADQKIYYQDKVSEPDPAPEKTGYKFTGWYTDEACEDKYDFSTEVDKDFTLYAGYEQLEYDLTFNANGGSDAPEKVVMRFEDEAKIPTSEPTYPGHTFKGWATSKDNADKGIVAFTPDQTYRAADTDKAPSTELFAVWDDIVVQISYNAENGGIVDPTSETINQDPDPSETLGGSKAIPNEGYHFVEWKNADNEQVGTDPTFVPSKPESGLYEPAVYTAFFAINQYVVTFDTDGKGESFTDVVNHGDKVSRPDDPTTEGYKFYDWYKDPEHKEPFNFDTDTITEDTVLYGLWSKLLPEDPEDPLKPAPGINVLPPADRVYTGSDIEPTDIKISCDGELLVLGKDYEIIGYEKNVEVGKGYVIVRGILPAFTGELKVPFNILPKSATKDEETKQNPIAVQTGAPTTSIAFLFVLLVLSTLVYVLRKTNTTTKRSKHRFK